jgi:DNA-directed RNA polymerase subunit K/omega
MDDENIDYVNDDEYDELTLDDDININEDINLLMKNYEENKKMYRARHKLTKFEKTRILSERSCMLANNSKTYIEKPERYVNAYDLALAEFNHGQLPFIIKRKYGNKYEYWKLADLM